MRKGNTRVVTTLEREPLELGDSNERGIRSSAPSPTLSLIEHQRLRAMGTDRTFQSGVKDDSRSRQITPSVRPFSNISRAFSKSWSMPTRRLSSKDWEADDEATPYSSPRMGNRKRVPKLSKERLPATPAKKFKYSCTRTFWILFLIALALRGLLSLAERNGWKSRDYSEISLSKLKEHIVEDSKRSSHYAYDDTSKRWIYSPPNWYYSPLNWDGKGVRPQIKVEVEGFRLWLPVPQRGQPGYEDWTRLLHDKESSSSARTKSFIDRSNWIPWSWSSSNLRVWIGRITYLFGTPRRLWSKSAPRAWIHDFVSLFGRLWRV